MGEQKRRTAAMASGAARICGNCAFFRLVQDPLGLCHRNPPIPVMVGMVASSIQGKPPQPMVQGHWPQTAAAQWCGEWDRRVEIADLDLAGLAAERSQGQA